MIENGMKRKILAMLTMIALFGGGVFTGQNLKPAQPTTDPAIVEPTNQQVTQPSAAPEAAIDEDGWYDTKNEVALYLHTYGHLPGNYMTKEEAEAEGWEGGPLCKVVPQHAIGGDVYHNYEGELPKKKGRVYYEADIGTICKKKRGNKRIIWSNDGLIYYTGNHYDSFELLYGEE